MTHRFFVDAAGLSREQSRQIAAVLRLRPGEEITLVRDGEEQRFRLDRVTSDGVEGTVLERRPATAEPACRLTLALPILKGDRTEEIVEATTQIGVSRFVPYVSARSVVRDLAPAKKARWERIALEAAEVAHRGRAPTIDDLKTWPTLVEALEAPIVVCWEEQRDGLLGAAAGPTLSLVVGPEGGLEVLEVDDLRARGASVVSLGPRVMRAETAAIAAVALALLAPGPVK